jgi:Zn-dependent oligopeptidase
MLRESFYLINFGFIISSMSDRNPLSGIVPRVIHRTDQEQATVAQQIEKIEGEVALDAYVKSQVSAPEVVKRITELENSLQRLANAVFASNEADKHPELRAAAEEAKLILKNRLEVDNTDHSKHRIQTELGPFKDELRLIKD